jgi:hypothetical protein
MPGGTVVCILFVFVLSAAMGMIAYCLRLARKYRMIETDMHCIYEGTIYHVVDIIYDRNDWFMRKARLHTDTYPFVVDVPISELRAVP